MFFQIQIQMLFIVYLYLLMVCKTSVIISGFVKSSLSWIELLSNQFIQCGVIVDDVQMVKLGFLVAKYLCC